MILDTNAISALFAGDAALAQILGSVERLSIPVIVIGEYRYGLRRSRLRAQLEPLLTTLIAETNVLVIDEGTTVAYASLRDDLRKSGRPIPENDVWIAALARQHGMPVLSSDAHFDAVPGLERIAW